MKMFISMLVMILVAVPVFPAATNAAPSAAEQERMFMEAVLFKQHGQLAEAEVRLKRLAELQPDVPTIKEMLTDVRAKLKAKEEDPANILRRKLAEIILPEVNFREANPVDVVDYLRDESAKLAADKAEINFVWLVPGDVKLGLVTLNLKKVPLGEVLTFVTRLAGLRYRIEAHAVVIYKPEPAATAPAPPNAKSE